MIDSHIHLSHKLYHQTFPYIDMDGEEFRVVYGTMGELIRKMKETGVTCCVEPAIDVASNALLLRLSSKYEGYLYPAVGNHPTRCIHSSFGDFKKVREYARDNRVIAIGETGLDYHLERKEQHRLRQVIWFLWQIRLAHQLGLPLILHIRDANKDAIRILRHEKKKLHGGVCHCFSGGADEAKIYTEELGLSLGIGGAVLKETERSASLKKAVAETPVEYLLLETDGPYVKPRKPDDVTGKQWEKARNTSLILPAVARKIAELKGLTQEEVYRITTDNAERVFKTSFNPVISDTVH